MLLGTGIALSHGDCHPGAARGEGQRYDSEHFTLVLASDPAQGPPVVPTTPSLFWRVLSPAHFLRAGRFPALPASPVCLPPNQPPSPAHPWLRALQ